MKSIPEIIAYLRREVERCKGRRGPEWNLSMVMLEQLTLESVLSFIEESQ